MGVEKLAALCHHLASAYLERAEEVEGAIVALGAKQHMLMIGPPGTAKSALIGDLARAVSGVTYFEWQVTKYTTPDELFGPLSLKGLENDSYRRITTGKAPEAAVMFLDEVFKANSSILNSLLSLINERKFYNDGQPTASPLVSLFGVSNELPQGDEETALAAFADRFLLRYKVDYLAEDGDFAALLKMSQGQTAPQVTAQDLLDYQRAAEAVKVPDEVVEAMVQLRRELAHEGITASDRRWRQSLSALKARAALNGATEVKIDRDFDLLVHVLWPWDGDVATAFGQLLAKRYTVPFLPEWVPWVLREARDQGWVTGAEVYKADPSSPVAVFTVNLTEEDLEGLVKDGIKQRKLKFPPEDGAEETGDLSVATDVTSYLKTFAPALGSKLAGRFKPRHEMGAGHEAFKGLLRKPFAAQGDVILGLAETLRAQRNAVVVGEMGTGKTLMGAVVPYVLNRDRYRVLVMCPGHLVKKWAREISITVPGAVVHLIEGWEDVLKFRNEPVRPVGREYWVISRDRAKLGYSLKPAVVWSRRRKSLVCPDCGEPLVDKDGVALGPSSFAAPRATNWKCPKCGSVLWQADRLKVWRYAPAEFMKRYLRPGFFDLFVGDECHELKGDSAQGNAFGSLASLAKRTLAMTGTLLGVGAKYR